MSYAPLYANNNQTDYGAASRASIFNGIHFFIPNDESDRERYVELISSNGGIIDNAPIHAQSYILSTNFRNDTDTYSFNYIDDSLTSKIQHDISSYKNAVPSYSQSQVGSQPTQYHDATQQQYYSQPLIPFPGNNIYQFDNPNEQASAQQQQQQDQISNFTPQNDFQANHQQFQHLQQMQFQQQQQEQQQQQVIGAGPGGVPYGQSKDSKRNTNSKHIFTEEEDAYILEAVRRDPKRRKSHKLFDEIAQNLTSHTGNSIRYRYRNQLAKKLAYYYEVDSEGDLVLDVSGHPVKVPFHDKKELPGTMKKKFTAEEDLELCAKIIKYNEDNYAKKVEEGSAKEPLDYDHLTVPVSFFRTMESAISNHSRAAWRDRYRKFASVIGVKAYYDQQKALPEEERFPMKDCTKRKSPKEILGKNKRVNTGHEADSNGDLDDEVLNSKEVALDEEIGELKSSNIRAFDGEVNFAAADNDEIDDDEDNDEFVDAPETAVAEEKNSKEVTEVTSGNAKDKRDSKNTSSPGKSQLDGDDEGALDVSYPNSKTKISDMVKDTFFTKTEEEVLRMIDENYKKMPADASIMDIFDFFETEIGFTTNYCALGIMYTNAAIGKFIEYSKLVVEGIFDYKKKLQNGESLKGKEYLIFEIKGISGIWNKEYDDALVRENDADLALLRKVQGDEAIEFRRGFVAQTRPPPSK